MNWYISTNGTSWTLCSTAGIERGRLALRANGIDEFTWQISGDMLAAEAYAHGSTVYLGTGATAAAVTCRFVGCVTSVPRQGMSVEETVSYRASGGWWWLDQVVYFQAWQTMRSSDNALVNTNIPRVVLGQDDAGDRRTMGAEVAAAIDWAIARGVSIAKGTIDTLALCPCSEHTTITCGEVIRQALRLQPDTVCYFDYSNLVAGVPVPKFHCRAPSALTAVDVPLAATDADSISMTPRYDLQAPGLTVYFQTTYTLNGQSFRTVATDAAGTTSDPRAVSLFYELDGFSAEIAEQAIIVEAYPVSTADKTFWKARVPWLADIVDADLTIANVTRSGSKNLGNFLKAGQIVPWMAVDSEQETWQAEVSYTSKTSGAVDEVVTSKKITFAVLSCGGTTKTYRTTLSYTAAEEQPTGLAAALYASWSHLHWDGAVRLVEAEASFQVGPWNRLNITGGLTAWATMAALVQEASIDLDAGTTSLTTGTCGRLQADSMLALWRGVHYRKFSLGAASRTDAGAATSVTQGGTELAGQNNNDGDPGRFARLILRAQSAESLLQTIDLDPSAVAHASVGDRTNRTLQPREIQVAYFDAGVLKLRSMQVIGSDAYGTGILANAATTSTWKTLGVAAVGGEAAMTDSWSRGTVAGEGCCLLFECRQRYFCALSKTWFAYVRALNVEAGGHVLSITQEARFAIEVPETA